MSLQHTHIYSCTRIGHVSWPRRYRAIENGTSVGGGGQAAIEQSGSWHGLDLRDDAQRARDAAGAQNDAPQPPRSQKRDDAQLREIFNTLCQDETSLFDLLTPKKTASLDLGFLWRRILPPSRDGGPVFVCGRGSFFGAVSFVATRVCFSRASEREKKHVRASPPNGSWRAGAAATRRKQQEDDLLRQREGIERRLARRKNAQQQRHAATPPRQVLVPLAPLRSPRGRDLAPGEPGASPYATYPAQKRSSSAAAEPTDLVFQIEQARQRQLLAQHIHTNRQQRMHLKPDKPAVGMGSLRKSAGYSSK